MAPLTPLPVGVSGWPCAVTYDIDEALPDADAVMMLQVQRERMLHSLLPTEREYSRRYGLNADRMSMLLQRPSSCTRDR